MIINNNMNAMNAHRNMSFNTAQTGKAMEKLSSGFRINRAGDEISPVTDRGYGKSWSVLCC